MTARKKGLSIGAAMKQRMDSQEQSAPDVPEAAPAKPSEKKSEQAPVSSTAPDETEALESFNTRLPRGLHRRLKVHTAAGGHKIQDVVALALAEYLERADKKES